MLIIEYLCLSSNKGHSMRRLQRCRVSILQVSFLPFGSFAGAQHKMRSLQIKPQSPVFMKNGTYENFIWCSNLNRNTWENLKSVETVKKPYLESPSVLFLLLLRVYHLGQQGQDLLYSPSCPAVPVSLHGQDHTSDAAVDIVPSEQQQ